MQPFRAPAWPLDHPRSHLEVRVEDTPMPVLRLGRGDLALWTGERDADVVIRCDAPVTGAVTVAPRRLGIQAEVRGHEVRLRLPGPGRAVVEIPGQRQLYLCAERAPEPAPAGARVLAAGMLHRLPPMELDAGAALWIERGAVLNGFVRARHPGVRLGGGGIISGRELSRQRLVVLDGAHGAQVRDLAIVDPPCWNLVVGASDDTTVEDLVVLTPGSGSATDGIDLCGSSRVRVRRCLSVAGDDAVVVKALPCRYDNDDWNDWSRPVSDVEVSDCVLGAYGGSCMEIGHELTVDRVGDITFRDIDVLFAHDFGMPISIRNADRAVVEQVRFERIRIEHCYYQLFDIRVIRSRYSRDTQRGRIRGITLRDLEWWTTPYNAGYTISHIGGWDADHLVEDVALDMRIDGTPITSVDALNLFTRHAQGIRVAAR